RQIAGRVPVGGDRIRGVLAPVITSSDLSLAWVDRGPIRGLSGLSEGMLHAVGKIRVHGSTSGACHNNCHADATPDMTLPGLNHALHLLLASSFYTTTLPIVLSVSYSLVA